MDQSPRHLFAMIAAGMKKEVLQSNAPWYCVSCYYCMVRCPQEIHITDIMYTLKNMSIKEGYAHKADKEASAFSGTFIEYVEQNGRSFELGLATRRSLSHGPMDLVKKAGMGMGMFTKGRLTFIPKKIKGIDQLQAIIAKAKTLGG